MQENPLDQMARAHIAILERQISQYQQVAAYGVGDVRAAARAKIRKLRDKVASWEAGIERRHA